MDERTAQEPSAPHRADRVEIKRDNAHFVTTGNIIIQSGRFSLLHDIYTDLEIITNFYHAASVGIASFPYDVVFCSSKGGGVMPQPKKKEEDLYKRMTISFEPRQLEQVIEYCQRNDRGIAWVIRRALTEFLERHKDDHL